MALDEICGMETFHNLHFIAFDNSDVWGDCSENRQIRSEELKTHAFKNKKQKISEHLSDVLNAIVLQTVDYAESSTNIQNNHRGQEFVLKLLGITPMRPKLLGMHNARVVFMCPEPFV